MGSVTYHLSEDVLLTHRSGAVLALAPLAYSLSFARLEETDVLAAVPFAVSRAGDASARTVAIVDIRGPISQRAEAQLCSMIDGYDAIERRFASALDQADAVVLRIDSPGGDVAGLWPAIERMKKKKAEAGKPVVAFADEVAASAAYALALVADEVYAPSSPGVHVGSVGAIAVHVDRSAALQQDGLKTTVIRSGAMKALGLGVEPLTEVGQAKLQAAVDAAAEMFAAQVAEARGLAVQAVLDLEGDVFSAQRAEELGLLDGIKSWDEVIAMTFEKIDQKQQATFGGRVLALTGEADPAKAEAKIVAALGALPRLAELERKVDTQARVEVLRSAIVARRLDPGEAWADPEVGAASGPAELWASVPIETLKTHLDRRQVRAADGPKHEPRPDAAQVDTAEVLELARAHGIDPKDIRQAKAALRWG